MCRKLRSRHLALLSAGLIGAIQLAGCAAPAPLPPSVPVAAPSAQRVEVTHRVRFDTDQEQPTALELAGLDSFLSQIPVGTRAEFRVIDRAHEGAEDTHALDLSARRAEAIARRIRQRMGPEAAVSTAA